MDQVTPDPTTGALTFDLARDFAFEVNLNRNVSSITVLGYENLPGQSLEFYFIQDSTGGRTIASGAWPSYIKLAGGAITLSTAPGKCDAVLFRRLYSVARFQERTRAMNS